MDVHGAGAQRSDPKTGTPGLGHGPQGDARRINNFVRCVRGGNTGGSTGTASVDHQHYPFKVRLVANLPGMPGPAAVQWRNGLSQGPEGGNQAFRFRNGDQHQEAPGMGMNFIRRLDKDGDGRVSRSEFDGPPDRFDFHDTDHDGYISETEAPRHPPMRGVQHR